MTSFLASVRAHATTGVLAHNVTTTRGQSAQAWLAALPDTVALLCERWDFTPSAVHPSSRRSLLVTGRMHTGHKAALKVEPRPTPQAPSLAAMNRAGHAPRVIAQDPTLHASLLEWIAAEPLGARLQDALAACTAVIKVNAIHHGLDDLPTERERVNTHNDSTRTRIAATDPTALVDADGRSLDRHLLDDLLTMDTERASTLPAVPSGTGLLHGDLVAANVLLDASRHVWFIATDPLTGPPEWDLAYLSLRMHHGHYVRTLPALLQTRWPDLDHDAIDWLITRHARGYLGYRLATRQPVLPLFVALAQATAASRAHLDGLAPPT